MGDLWTTLLPLVIGSAVVPIQVILTILLLRSSAGRLTSVAFVAGMITVRLLQGVIFGLVLSGSDAAEGGTDGSSVLVSTLLLVVGLLLLGTAAKQGFTSEDPDAPPPKWLAMTETISPAKAFGLGVLLLGVGAKFWVFTLSAIAAIGEADLGRSEGVAAFLLFVVGATSLQLVVLVAAFAFPSRSAASLDAAAGWLKDHNRILVIVVGLVFGVWFVLKALDGLGL